MELEGLDRDEQYEILENALRDHLYEFSSALDGGTPPEEIISRFFHPHNEDISIHEHGPAWSYEVLKFLGEWKGRTSAGAAAARPTSSSSGSSDDSSGGWRTRPSGPKREKARGSVLDYMQALGNALTPTRVVIEDFNFDLDGLFVSCTGEAEFQANESGQAWREKFCWQVEFMHVLPERPRPDTLRIWRWEIFADTLSAYLAVQGQHPQPL